jgi:proton-coupled amino acid transporter
MSLSRASFGDAVQTALTASLPQSVLATIVQLAYSIAVIFTFPLQAFPALEVVCHTTGTKVGKSDRVATLKRNVTASVIVCFLGVLAVVAIDYLGNVVSLLGSLVGIPIALIYPPLMHNQLVDSSKTTRFLNYSLSVVGFIAAGAASYTTITSWDKGAEG